MPTFLRISEILPCIMAGFLPYILLILYPFRNHLRQKGSIAVIGGSVLAAAKIYLDLHMALDSFHATVPYFGWNISFQAIRLPFPSPVLWAALLLIYSVLAIDAPMKKNLLNTLSVINFSLLTHSLADSFAAAYSVSHLLITLLVQAAVLIPYGLCLAARLAPTLNCVESPAWGRTWIVPAAGAGIGCLWLMTGWNGLPAVMILLILASAGTAAWFLHKTETEMITLVLKKKKAVPQAAAPQPQQPDLMRTYLDQLQARMLDSECTCKELLLQVMTMEDDLNQQAYDQLRARLDTLRRQLSPDAVTTGNSQIDPVVAYFHRQAVLSNIKIVTSLSLPEYSLIPDEDLTVLIGCLMDSALHACREQTSGTRRIAVATNSDADTFQIGIKNTYSTAMDYSCDSLQLCRQIAAKHSGKLSINGVEGVSQIIVSLSI